MVAGGCLVNYYAYCEKIAYLLDTVLNDGELKYNSVTSKGKEQMGVQDISLCPDYHIV